MFNALIPIFKILMNDKVIKRFAVGVVAGLGFSMAVILITIGIMDGFEDSLKMGLKKSSGDLTIHSRNGFFKEVDNFANSFKTLDIKDYSSYVKSEGFLIFNDRSKGVQVNGVESKSFGKVTGFSFDLKNNEIAIGKNLAEEFEINISDEVVIAFPNGNKEFSTLPLLKRFKIGDIITHGIYEKDSRIVYLRRDELQKSMSLGVKVNALALNLPDTFIKKYSNPSKSHTDLISDFKVLLEGEIDFDYFIKPFWREYSGLLEAVKAEKVMISIILQIIVVISIFNVIAFIVFINEKRSRELFLFKAVGLSQSRLSYIWYALCFALWVASCAFSQVLVVIMQFLLQRLDMFKLPGEIYVLGSLDIRLDSFDYLLVFTGALCWLLIISTFVFYRMRKSPILKGLRQEFS